MFLSKNLTDTSLTKKIYVYRYFLLLGILTFFAVLPLLHAGLPPTHDGEYHVIRFYEFYKSFSEGNIYPRWASDLNAGFGVPLFNFVYPFPNYIAAFLHSFGISFIDAFKWNLLFATFIASYGFYFFMRYFFDDLSSFFGAVLYTYAPYRFVDIYIRGSVGEVWALAFLPFLLLYLVKAIEQRRIYIIPAGILFSLIIFSHNILALMFTPFIFLFGGIVILRQKKKFSSVISLFLILLIGISLSSIFWLPALVEKSYVQGLEIYDVTKNFVDLYQLLIPSWGTGFSGGGLENQMSFQIGPIHLLLSVLSIIIFVFDRKRREQSRYFIFMVIYLLFVIGMMLPVSDSIWRNVPLLSYVQFPWRLLSLVIFITPFLSVYFVNAIKSDKLRLVTIFSFIGIVIVTTIAYTKPAYYHNRNDKYYIARSNFIDGTNSPGNVFNTKWIQGIPKRTKDQIIPKKGQIIVEGSKKSQARHMKVNVMHKGNIEFSLAYFPGWTVFLDGQMQPSWVTKQGTIETSISSGQHSINILFLDTITRRVASIWSLVTIFIILFLSIRYIFYKST